MDTYVILIIAVALAMDAFAAAVASGIAMRPVELRHALAVATWFGAFQAIMPFLGWAAGRKALRWVAGVDHWLAFALLVFIGAKLIYEAIHFEDIERKTDPRHPRTLFCLAVATSIDALAVGVGFAVLKVSVLFPVLVIGVVTFFLSLLGVWVGERMGHFFERRIEVVAGLLLIGIGCKILISG